MLFQRTYELIHPMVLFGMPSVERAAQTRAAERTLDRQVERFSEDGMAKLFPTLPVAPPPRLSNQLRRFIATVKAEHPRLHLRELQTLCYVGFGRRRSPQTIKRVLANATPLAVERRCPRFHQTDLTA